jgi:uncharacterized membrane protein YhhN
MDAGNRRKRMANLDASKPGEELASPVGAETRRADFVVLWLMWAGLLTAAMFLGIAEGHGGAGPTTLRMGSSVVLVVAGWWAFARWRTSAVGGFALAIAVGMTLGAIGDFFNAGLLDFVPLPDATLGGIISFGLGHVAYIVGCIQLDVRTGLTDRRAMTMAVVGWQLVGLAAWYGVVMLGTERRPLVWPALPYSLLLAGTAGVTAGLAIQEGRLLLLAIGAGLFLASDLILAFELFRGSFAYDTVCVWLTYGPGQMLIVFSILAAARVLGAPRHHLKS